MGFSRVSLLPLCLMAATAQGEGKIDPSTLVQVELLSTLKTAAPGEAIPLALHFKIAPGWHIYWENPGDSGQATRASFTGPEGLSFSSLTFPGPERFELAGDIVNFGYDDEAVLFAEAKVPQDITGAKLPLSAEVRWLVCHDRCIPQSKTVSLSLALGDAPSENEAVTAKVAPFMAQIPAPFGSQAVLNWAWQEGDVLKLRGPEGAKVSFFPGKGLPYGAGAVKSLSGGRTALVSFPGGVAPVGTIGVEQGGVVSYFQLVPSDVPKS